MSNIERDIGAASLLAMCLAAAPFTCGLSVVFGLWAAWAVYSGAVDRAAEAAKNKPTE